MKVLAVTCYTGGPELAKMTSSCLQSLRDCAPSGIEFKIVVCSQGAKASAISKADVEVRWHENVGFAFGMNTAIEHGVWQTGAPDHVLCFNNDLQFPDKDWLRKLLEIAAHPTDQVLVPATDSAAIRVQPRSLDKDSYPVEESSAYCWLVPFAWCQWLKKEHGFWLFDEDFAPGFAEDNWTAYLLSKQFGEKVFRYVPRSFVKHLRSRTTRTVVVDRRITSRILKDKFQRELEDPKLRPDLRAWAKRYVRILKT